MNTTRVDWAAVKADFPVLQRMIDGQRLVYLDSANTSQKPNAVIDAMTDFSRLEHVVSSFSRRWNRDKHILRGYNARLCRQTPSARSR